MTVAFYNSLMLFIVLHPPVHNRRFSLSKNPTKHKATNEEVMIFESIDVCVWMLPLLIYVIFVWCNTTHLVLGV